MKVGRSNYMMLLLSFLLTAGGAIETSFYDYSATIECLAEPLNSQYRGGIITNPEFNEGLKGWSVFGNGKIERRVSKGGNSYIVARARNNPHDSFSQKLYMQRGKLYTFSAWFQVSEGKEQVRAIIKTRSDYRHVGIGVAESGCWSMLKAGLTVDSSGPAELYFESENTRVEIWVDSVALQPFTKEQWRSHQDHTTEKARKRKVKIQATAGQGKILSGATVLIKQIKAGFPIGSVINKPILYNTAYQKWFTSRFTVTTFGNEMKWYSTETSPSHESYSVSDAMLNFAKQHGVAVRGHNIFWDDERYQPYWIKSLSPDRLKTATEKRLNSVVSKYTGKVIHWDVVNEDMHFSYFEEKLGKDFSVLSYRKTHQLDSSATLFLNEYNTIEDNRDNHSCPSMYLQKLREIQSYQAPNTKLGIGIESHFNITYAPNIAYMRAALDTLGATGLPIWLTELDILHSPYQVQYLEEILREAHSHPAVKGIVLWTSRYPDECTKMCLTDGNFKNFPTGDLVDKLIHEWTQTRLVGVMDSNGLFETSLYHGDYKLKINDPRSNISLSRIVKVEPAESSYEATLNVKILDI